MKKELLDMFIVCEVEKGKELRAVPLSVLISWKNQWNHSHHRMVDLIRRKRPRLKILSFLTGMQREAQLLPWPEYVVLFIPIFPSLTSLFL